MPKIKGKTERVEFRLDAETKRALLELARSRGLSLGETIRQILRENLGLPALPSKEDAARCVLSLGVPCPPDPATLRREIADALAGD